MSSMIANRDSPSGGQYEQNFRNWWEDENDPLVLYRNEQHGLYVRLDERPVTWGHMMAIPFEGAKSVDHLPGPRHDKLWRVAQFVGLHMEDVLRAREVPYRYMGTLVAGAQVWHAHVHRAACMQGPDWLKAFAGIPREQACEVEPFEGQKPLSARLELTEQEWADTVKAFGFTAAAKQDLDDYIAAVGPAEDLAAMEQHQVDLRAILAAHN